MSRRNRLLLIGLLVALGAGLFAYNYWAPHAPRAERATKGGSSSAVLILLMLAVASATRRRKRRDEEEGRNG